MHGIGQGIGKGIGKVEAMRRKDAISLLLQSIAMEEMSLAALVGAEAEKVGEASSCAAAELNESVRRTLREATRFELLLLMKLEETLDATAEDGYRPCSCHCHPKD